MHFGHIVVAAEKQGQDRLQVMRLADRLVFALADGAGGRSGGAEAAELAVKLVMQQAAELNSQSDCEKVLRQIDTAIAAEQTCGETTGIVAVVSETEIYGASAGDSGAWLVDGLTIDELTRDQPRKPFLGDGAAVVGFRREAWQGTLLIATDGLLKYTSREAIATAIGQTNFSNLPEALVKLVRYPSGNLPDDIAIAVCRPN